MRRGINSPPEGGVQVPQGLRPGPRGLLRRGRHAPWTPWAAPPRVPFGTRAPRGLGLPVGGCSGHGCARWPGWSTRSVVHAGRPAPSPPEFSFSKARQPERGQAAGLSTGGRQSLQRRRWADLGTARQGGCPPWVGSEVVHGQSGPQGAVFALKVPARRRRSGA